MGLQSGQLASELSLADFRQGLQVVSISNPEEWWDFQDLHHPVGNLNISLLQACSCNGLHEEVPLLSMDVEGVGELQLRSSSVELVELFKVFEAIYASQMEETRCEWKQFATTQQFGPAIQMVGRAEKRLVVVAARKLLGEDMSPEAFKAVWLSFKENTIAVQALRQLSRNALACPAYGRPLCSWGGRRSVFVVAGFVMSAVMLSAWKIGGQSLCGRIFGKFFKSGLSVGMGTVSESAQSSEIPEDWCPYY
jgi:hypothetical protein